MLNHLRTRNASEMKIRLTWLFVIICAGFATEDVALRACTATVSSACAILGIPTAHIHFNMLTLGDFAIRITSECTAWILLLILAYAISERTGRSKATYISFFGLCGLFMIENVIRITLAIALLDRGLSWSSAHGITLVAFLVFILFNLSPHILKELRKSTYIGWLAAFVFTVLPSCKAAPGNPPFNRLALAVYAYDVHSRELVEVYRENNATVARQLSEDELPALKDAGGELIFCGIAGFISYWDQGCPQLYEVLMNGVVLKRNVRVGPTGHLVDLGPISRFGKIIGYKYSSVLHNYVLSKMKGAKFNSNQPHTRYNPIDIFKKSYIYNYNY